MAKTASTKPTKPPKAKSSQTKQTRSSAVVRAPARAISYRMLHAGIADVLRQGRSASARSINALMTASYWEIGRRIVEAEQSGQRRADYGKALIEQLAEDLSTEFGRGYGVRNLAQMRSFYLTWPAEKILQTVSAKLPGIEILQTVSAKSKKSSRIEVIPTLSELARAFHLPWSAYVSLLSVKDESARTFYEAETLRGGWSVRQLGRQINTLFYERTRLSRKPEALQKKTAKATTEDRMSLDDLVRDPYVLEFLDIKDAYSETDLEEAMILQLENVLLELGDDFAFIGRQKRLRLDDNWFRVDLTFFHRGLRCLVLIDLKLGRFSHTDAGQMNMYLNYARENWMRDSENPPVGLILCSEKGNVEAHYALTGLPNKMTVSRYQTLLPTERELESKLKYVTRRIETHHKKRLALQSQSLSKTKRTSK